MSSFSVSEPAEIVPAKAGSNISLDDFKSIYYQLNAKPDTEIRLLRGKKNVSLADIRSINEQILEKLRNHEVITNEASINFILSNRSIKDYAAWAEFERENWDTVNESVQTLSINWDVTIKLPQYELPQRHSVKVRVGSELPPKDLFQILLTSDNISELMEMQTPSICKIDFVNNTLAIELLNIVSNWHEGLQNLPDMNSVVKFLRKNGSSISEIIRYSSPIVLMLIFYRYSEYAFSEPMDPQNITIKELELLIIVLSAMFVIGTFIGFKLERFIDVRISQFKEHPSFSITRGDRKAIEAFELSNKKLTNQILTRIFWVIATIAISSSFKFVASYIF